MFGSEFLYPIWSVTRILLVLFTSKKNLLQHQELLLTTLCATLPFGYALSFVTGYQHFALCELAVFISLIQMRFQCRNHNTFTTIIFTLHLVGPFCKFTFGTLNNIEFPGMHLPSVFDLMVQPNEVDYSSFLFLLYPMPFFGQSDEKFENNS